MLWDLSILDMECFGLVWLPVPSVPSQSRSQSDPRNRRGSGPGEQQGGSWGPAASLLALALGLDWKDKVRSILLLEVSTKVSPGGKFASCHLSQLERLSNEIALPSLFLLLITDGGFLSQEPGRLCISPQVLPHSCSRPQPPLFG